MSTYLIFNQLQIIHPQFRHKSRSGVLEPSQNFLSRHEAKERLYVEEAPIKCGSKGIYNTIELFSTVPQNSSKMALSHILILPCCHSKCSYIVVM
ncbi:neurotrimin-like isoform X2 [Vespula maculifrons]|uniref:Neurotrimin-like isoform X2 n=1 Tax=Vespula maculifrons TaxID=7453 RepID=A0ABD2BEF3_VESMC